MRKVDYSINVNDAISSHPDCFVRFFAFTKRDTTNDNVEHIDTEEISIEDEGKIDTVKGVTGIVVEPISHEDAMAVKQIDATDDILSCQVNKDKSRAAGTFSIVLAPGNHNYHQEIYPGDHVLIFMKRNGEVDFNNLAHSLDSGLKMYGVVQSVRKNFSVDESGMKQLRYTVAGDDFGHFFETDIYFNAILAEKLSTDPVGVLYPTLGSTLDLDMANPGANVSVLIDAFVGNKLTPTLSPSKFATPNKVFSIPGPILDFFGLDAIGTQTGTFRDILHREIGILRYSDTDVNPTATDLPGTKFINIDTGSKHTLWSVLQTYSNTCMNEMFLDMKPSDTDDGLRPTLVLRQIPYTTLSFGRATNYQLGYTEFTNLPRLIVDEDVIFEEDIGRAEGDRHNFIQLTGNAFSSLGLGDSTVFQTLMGNFAIDTESISRYGLKAFFQHSDYDLNVPGLRGLIRDVTADNIAAKVNEYLQSSNDSNSLTLIPEWIKFYSDWFMRAHLFETGNFTLIGIEEPISIGDNLQVNRPNGNSELYHIQSYAHSYSVSGGGMKTFRTHVGVTRGQMVDGSPIRDSDNIGISNTRTRGN